MPENKLEFKYIPWDGKKDRLLENAGSALGFGVIQHAIEVGKRAQQRERDPLVGPTLDGVYGILASCIQWLRWYGESPEVVQNRVKAAILRFEAGHPTAAQDAKDIADSTDRIADGGNLEKRFAKDLVIG